LPSDEKKAKKIKKTPRGYTLKHVLSPNYDVMNEEEAVKVLQKYNICRQNLPKIKNTDAVVKEIDAKIGDVLRILRHDTTANYFYYRLVVK